MNDVFLNFMFERKEFWDVPKSIVNILSEEYSKQTTNQNHKMPFIEGDVVVETQYRHMLAMQGTSDLKRQDIKVMERNAGDVSGNKAVDDTDTDTANDGSANGNTVYIEFQNQANTRPPISERGLQYFGLGIGQDPDKRADQIWLLAKSSATLDDRLLHGRVFSNYTLKDENNAVYPNASGITYINLDALARQNSKAGQLAAVLLGHNVCVSYPEVKAVSQYFSNALSVFKKEKEAEGMLSFADRKLEEGFAQGIEQGIMRSAKVIAKKFDMTIEEAMSILDKELDLPIKEGVADKSISHESSHPTPDGQTSDFDNIIKNLNKVANNHQNPSGTLKPSPQNPGNL